MFLVLPPQLGHNLPTPGLNPHTPTHLLLLPALEFDLAENLRCTALVQWVSKYASLITSVNITWELNRNPNGDLENQNLWKIGLVVFWQIPPSGDADVHSTLTAVASLFNFIHLLFQLISHLSCFSLPLFPHTLSSVNMLCIVYLSVLLLLFSLEVFWLLLSLRS